MGFLQISMPITCLLQYKVNKNLKSYLLKILRESEEYFDKVYAVESKDLKFFFDDDPEQHDNLMYVYFMQVCPHQTNLDVLSQNLEISREEVEENIQDPPSVVSENTILQEPKKAENVPEEVTDVNSNNFLPHSLTETIDHHTS